METFPKFLFWALLVAALACSCMSNEEYWKRYANRERNYIARCNRACAEAGATGVTASYSRWRDRRFCGCYFGDRRPNPARPRGWSDVNDLKQCPECEGLGHLMADENMMSPVCPTCDGTGTDPAPQLFCPMCDRWTTYTETYSTRKECQCDFLQLTCGMPDCGLTSSVGEWAEATAAAAGKIRAQTERDIAAKIRAEVERLVRIVTIGGLPKEAQKP